MKNLLFIPLDWHKKNVQLSLYEGLEKYFNCQYYSGITAELFNDIPDVIYIQSGAMSIEKLVELKEMCNGATVIQWTGDCRPTLLPEVLQYKGVADLTMLACGLGQKAEYESALGHRVEWLQHAASMFLEPQRIEDNTIAFVGNYYDQFPGGEERNKLCFDIDVKYGDEFFCYGSWADSRGQVPYDDTPWIYNNAFVSISANIYNNIEGYWSNRPYDILAAGSCCLMRYVPGIERHFEDMKHCVYYHSNEEAMEKIEWLFANPSERDRIATEGYIHVRDNHSYDIRAKEIWELLQ
jgi:hypothetical protein